MARRPEPGSIPEQPGVYRWRDAQGRVIYVGKAKSLRQRLNSYFSEVSTLHPRTQQMVQTAESLDWVVVGTEVEALQLEYSWIKEYDPRFNVRYRDDKTYPWLAVTVGEEHPRVQVMRGPKRKGVRYFGPYPHAWAIRETLDLLLRVFPVRTCSAGVFKRAGQVGRPCLLGYIDKCSAPCVGRVTAQQHRELVDGLIEVLDGRTERHLRSLERQMQEAASAQAYEKAARLRDDVGALRRAIEKQAVVLADGTDADVVAFAADELEAAVQLFHVRGGRVRGQRGWVVDLVPGENCTEAGADLPMLVEQFLSQEYLSGDPAGHLDVPREVLVQELPAGHKLVCELLSLARGSRVEVRVPQRGDKRSLLGTVTRNAEQALTLHRLRRAGDLTSRSRALSELQQALGLAEAPLRIECYDVSHVQGTDVVASMVVFEDGLARKSDYRRFILKGAGTDDTAWMTEVLQRRFRRLQEGEPPAPGEAEPGAPGRFAYAPGLVVVDGGPPQVSAAVRALAALGIDAGVDGEVPVVGLAKRLEEVWLPGSVDPVILPRSSEALFLLQRLRDEAHRFAVTFHRQRRSRSMIESELDGIPGLGEVRTKLLLRHFGSAKRLRSASLEEIASLPGIGRTLAAVVVGHLSSGVSGSTP
jgi:excinuclease ABC subunit C